MNSRVRLCLTFAVAVAIVAAFPAIAAASTAGTLYSATLTGSLTFKSVQAGTDGNWTTTATFPLNGTSANFAGETPAELDVWLPTGPVGATQTIDAITSPDYSITASDPNSSLTTVGSDPVNGSFNCGPFTVDNQLSPNLGVITTASGATSILVDWLGGATPANPAGNGNTFPASCVTNATFEMTTPLDGGDQGSPKFGIAWAPGYDTVRFAFTGISATAASQTLTGTDESEVATATGQSDTGMSCTNDGSNTCTESLLNTSETLKLTKVCSGTVTVEDGIVGGTCGSAPPPPPPAGKAPSGSKITKAKISSSKRSGTFSFTATGATGYQCALAAKPKKGHTAPKLSFRSCTSPKRYSHLRKGSYTFEVRGVNSTGHDPHPAAKSFKIG